MKKVIKILLFSIFTLFLLFVEKSFSQGPPPPMEIKIGDKTIKDNNPPGFTGDADPLADCIKFNSGNDPPHGFDPPLGYIVQGIVKLGSGGATIAFEKVVNLTDFRCVRMGDGGGGELVIIFKKTFPALPPPAAIFAGDGIKGDHFNQRDRNLGPGNKLEFQGYVNGAPIVPLHGGAAGVAAFYVSSPVGPIPSPVKILGGHGIQFPPAAASYELKGELKITLGIARDGVKLPNSAEVGISAIPDTPTVIMVPRTSVNLVNTEHSIIAAFINANGPIVGATVNFQRIGANPGAGSAITDSGGIARYFYTGSNMGTDIIIGSIMGLSDTVYNFWTSCDGGGLTANCNYFFANTECEPSESRHPVFRWEDTTGSTSLAVNGVNAEPSIFTGDLDDGYWSLGNILPTGEKFTFCGTDYDSFFVSTNGMIGLTRRNNSTKLDDFITQNIPSTSAIQPGLFPIWKDFNFADTDVPINRLSYKVKIDPGDTNKLIITYDRAPNFGATDPSDYASFQIILDIVPSGPPADGVIIYQYDDSKTGTEFLNKYFDFTLANHTVGIQDVTGSLGIQYRRVTAAGTTNVTIPGPLFSSPVAVAFGPDQNVPLTLNLTAFIEGFYNAATNSMVPDTLRVYLRNDFAPFSIVDSAKGLLNSSGTGTFSFSNTVNGVPYYIQVKHRNSIETWNATGQSFANSVLNYNFSVALTQAFGNNMIQVDNSPVRYAIYSGDVDTSGIVDGSDKNLINNASRIGASGYIPEDITGDDFVDGADKNIANNNSRRGVIVIMP